MQCRKARDLELHSPGSRGWSPRSRCRRVVPSEAEGGGWHLACSWLQVQGWQAIFGVPDWYFTLTSAFTFQGCSCSPLPHVQFCTHKPPFYKVTGPIGLGVTLRQYDLCNDPIFKKVRIST